MIASIIILSVMCIAVIVMYIQSTRMVNHLSDKYWEEKKANDFAKTVINDFTIKLQELEAERDFYEEQVRFYKEAYFASEEVRKKLYKEVYNG